MATHDGKLASNFKRGGSTAMNEGIISAIREDMNRTPDAKPDWKEYCMNYDRPLPETPTIFSICGTPIGFREGISVIMGKKKAAKSTYIAALCAAFIGRSEVLNTSVSENVNRVIIFDTEQPEFRVLYQVERSFRLAGVKRELRPDFQVIPLRQFSPARRLEIVVECVKGFQPDLAIVDGVADLVVNVNDPEQCPEVVGKLASIATECKCSLVVCIHTNSADPTGKQRGFIGSELERKQEGAIMLERDDDTGIFRVSARDTRDKPFPPFHFIRRDKDGDPELVSVADKPVTSTDKLVALMEAGRDYTRKELVQLLGEAGIKEETAKQAVRRCARQGYIFKNNQGYTLRTTNGANVGDGGTGYTSV